ncbi:hypothetical protein PoB_001337800 [Plakobranchus ocellatus]|uniref:Uncharacterized protein n=1 Tax=Plakobranchus ocellatus TaxID=259542 RepID=A0AAV3YXA5_9GAST|nr:hypothetical protein PoB_001337800 [Plakobranchus ocellatus]
MKDFASPAGQASRGGKKQDADRKNCQILFPQLVKQSAPGTTQDVPCVHTNNVECPSVDGQRNSKFPTCVHTRLQLTAVTSGVKACMEFKEFFGFCSFSFLHFDGRPPTEGVQTFGVNARLDRTKMPDSYPQPAYKALLRKREICSKKKR